jgi:pimeloyl-ACP methyl ester carboxylesterase
VAREPTASPTLPPPVVRVLDDPEPDPGSRTTVLAAGIPFSALEWGEPGGRPLVLIHGVAASARVWWRLGPALAATGRRVVAPDLPGHGRTGHWTGHHRFRDNARDVAAWIRAAALDVPDLQVVGHSYGAMTAAALPIAGIRPATAILLDPPALPLAAIATMATDPSELPHATFQDTVDWLTSANPAWSRGDVQAKAEALHEVDLEAARAILLENGDYDGGMADLADPAWAGIDRWVVRGDPSTGGLLPDAALPAFDAILGPGRFITLPGTPHSPQRSHPLETTAALLAVLDRGRAA